MPLSLCSDSDTNSRQPLYKYVPLFFLGFYTLHWDTPLCSYSPCSTQPLTAHTGLPTSMHVCPLPPCLASDFLHKSASSLWISSSPDLGFYSECHASLLFKILQTKWSSRGKLFFLCECLLIPLWHCLPMISPSMIILFSQLKFWHLMEYTSLPCFCGSCHFTLFEFWLFILGYSDYMDSSSPLPHL